MNTHLNIFRTYTKENRAYQLENDLTRSLAICMQEDNLFFYELLKQIFEETGTSYFSKFFESFENKVDSTIHIQKQASAITGFEKIIAVSLSENEMSRDSFWSQSNPAKYDPVCDIVVQINEVVIIFEVKRDAIDCTAQLYEQAYNICRYSECLDAFEDIVSPLDMNWPKLMETAVRVNSFEKVMGSPNRFLTDFIELVKGHNFRWLPEPPMYSIEASNRPALLRRLDSAINELCQAPEFDNLPYSDRRGLVFHKPWAREVIFDIRENGDLISLIYLGNTKEQGKSLFKKDPVIKKYLKIKNEKYIVEYQNYIKFIGNRSYVTSLYFDEKRHLKNNLYTAKNFTKTGRYKKEKWNSIENWFDEHFADDFDWRDACQWEGKVLKSNYLRIDLSFGYQVLVAVPFKNLQELDQDKNDLSGLTQLLKDIYSEYESLLV